MNPNGVVLATGGYDHLIRFWDADSGSSTRTIKVTDSQINALAVSPDKRFVAAACNPCIKVFDITKSNGEGAQSVYLDGHAGNVTNVGFDETSKWIYSGGEDGTIRIWDCRVQANACQRIFDGNKISSSPEEKGPTWNEKRKASVNSVILHPNQAELIVGDQGGRVRVYDLAGTTDGPALTINSPEPDVAVRSVAISSNGSQVFFATDSGNIYNWVPTSPQTLLGTTPVLKQPIRAHEVYILKIVVSPDGNFLASGSADHTAKIFRTADMSRHKVLTKHQRWVWDLQFSADSSYLVTASSDSTARLWDVNTGEAIRNFTGHHKAVVAVCLNDMTKPS